MKPVFEKKYEKELRPESSDWEFDKYVRKKILWSLFINIFIFLGVSVVLLFLLKIFLMFLWG